MAKSKDLRDIAITHYKNGKKAPEIAVLLANKVYRATIHRWICQYDRTGSFRAGKPTGRKRNGRTKRLVNLEEGDRLFGHSNWCLQQDGASAHTSKESQDWCKRHLKYFIPEDRWPPNSPELNPLDYSIWDSMTITTQPTMTTTQPTLTTTRPTTQLITTTRSTTTTTRE
ncbi:unnamed protein product [Rotaria sp. Silwood1]|nr:unnamed protein product [Rotaria sp. Silwood1]